MPSRSRLGRRAVQALLAVTLAVVGLLALALNVLAGGGGGDRPFDGQPMPALYPDRDLGIVAALTGPAEARADRAARAWLTRHPARDDGAFANYAVASVGPPPRGRAQARELAELHRIGAHRTRPGIYASVWLEAHGKKDVWKLYLKQYRDSVPDARGDAAKDTFNATYDLAKTVIDAAKNHYARLSPYITDPSLHAVNQSRFGSTKKYSYPSKHAVTSFAELTILARLEPHRIGELRWMADEVCFSRLYAAGHYPSDIAAGIYLGRLVADYELGAA